MISVLARRQQQVELCELAVEAVKALGFQAGVLHVELKYTSQNGPQLIEVCQPAMSHTLRRHLTCCPR